jgi:ABC-type multidrug transport system fused ATPase/permease subunit
MHVPQIQETIRNELSYATVVTIAHRLKTIVDYDRVLVLGEGTILEFEAPQILLSQQDSIFGELCRKSADWPVLKAMVEEHSGESMTGVAEG